MSMIIHLGLNFEVPISEECLDEPIEIDTKREEGLIVQQNHFTTPYIYEILEGEKYEPIWSMSQFNEQYSPHNLKKAQKTYELLCDLFINLLPKGDYCELYCCWIGEEEEEPIEQKVMIDLNSLNVETIYVEEKHHFILTNS